MSKPSEIKGLMAHIINGPYEYHPQAKTIETADSITVAIIPNLLKGADAMGKFMATCANRYPQLLAAAEQLAEEIKSMPPWALDHISFQVFEGLVDALALDGYGDLKPRTAPDVLKDMIAELEGPMHGHWTEGMSNFVQEAQQLLVKPSSTPPIPPFAVDAMSERICELKDKLDLLKAGVQVIRNQIADEGRRCPSLHIRKALQTAEEILEAAR